MKKFLIKETLSEIVLRIFKKQNKSLIRASIRAETFDYVKF